MGAEGRSGTGLNSFDEYRILDARFSGDDGPIAQRQQPCGSYAIALKAQAPPGFCNFDEALSGFRWAGTHVAAPDPL